MNFKILDFKKLDFKKLDFKKLDFNNLVEPINSYYMVIPGFFDDCLKEKKKKEKDDLLTCMASPQVKSIFNKIAGK